MMPSLPVTVPTWYARAVTPLKSVMVLGSTFRPCRVMSVKGRVISSGPGMNSWMSGGALKPPRIGFGAGRGARLCFGACRKPKRASLNSGSAEGCRETGGEGSCCAQKERAPARLHSGVFEEMSHRWLLLSVVSV